MIRTTLLQQTWLYSFQVKVIYMTLKPTRSFFVVFTNCNRKTKPNPSRLRKAFCFPCTTCTPEPTKSAKKQAPPPLFRRACYRRFPPFLRLLGTMAIKNNDPAARKRCPIIWSPTVPSSFAFPGNSCFCLPSPCLLRVSSPSNLPTTDTRYSKSLRHAWEMSHC